MLVLKATRTEFDGPHPPIALPDPLGKQSLLAQRMVQRLITGLRQYLLANLDRRLSLLPVVLLLHPCGRLRVVLDIDILVHDTQAVQMSARPLRVPTPVSPIDFNHTLVSSRRHSWSPWTTCTSQMHGCTLQLLGGYPDLSTAWRQPCLVRLYGLVWLPAGGGGGETWPGLTVRM
jgi:hypothetical protein